MIFYDQPTDPWTPYDFKLLEAYQILQDEICPTCGNPIWLCRSTDPNVNAIVRTAICYGKAELETKEKKREDSKGKKSLKPGEYEYVVFEPIDKEKGLPSREDYFASLEHG